MHPIKEEFANDVIQIVDTVCEKFFNSQEDTKPSFQLTHEQCESAIKKIVIALPDSIFYSSYPEPLEEMKGYLSDEFILFQMQENWDDPEYSEDLINFIYSIAVNIQKKLAAA